MNQAPCSSPASNKTIMESCCELHPPVSCPPKPCPVCGQPGKAVGRITLGALLKPERRAQIPLQEECCFCKNAACAVVYFLPGQVVFRKDDLAVRVGLKEPDDLTVPVCYCFGWTPQQIRAEVALSGRSTTIEQIKTQVKAGNCYCEVTNPQGSCCLGNVAKAVQDATVAVTQKGGVRI